MSFGPILSIIEWVTKQIDKWQEGAKERRLKKVSSIKIELEKLKYEIKVCVKTVPFRSSHYAVLLSRKRMLEQRLESMAG